MFGLVGFIGLVLGFIACAISVVSLIIGQVVWNREGQRDLGETFAWAGRSAAILTFVGLTVSVGILAYCFLVGDYSIQYVLDNHSTSSSSLGWLYKLSGVWAGREGSLLFWAWLISLFNLLVSCRRKDKLEPLDNMATLVTSVVLLAFLGVLLFSADNQPFLASDEKYFNYAKYAVTTSGSVLGMNSLLEHWAMAVHPPTLFIGYAGLTIPFAYAIAAVIINDGSKSWVERSGAYAIFSWVMLSIGIGLGSIWAYVCLGWGGYWGWDPVENASLLSWLMAVALIHTFTAYRQRGSFKKWAILCACLTFSFVIVGTFISRSGLVQSVHAFEGDPVSLALFLSLILISAALGVVGVLWRGDTFASEVGDDIDSMLSKDAMYYLNCVVMVLVTFLVAYLTLAEALPSFLPFGGQSISSGTYETIARPLSILYLAMVAVGPLMAWGKTDRATFLHKMRVPLILAAILFVVLLVFFFTKLLPVYDAAIAAGGSVAEGYLEMGPTWYYNGLAIVGFAVASVLFFNAGAMVVRCVKLKVKPMSAIGGAIAHTSLAIILVGLIGSSMYVTETTGYVAYDSQTDTCSETFVINDYELIFTDSSIVELDNGNVNYLVGFDAYRDGQYVGHVTPSVELVSTTQQQKLNASVISLPDEDLFVVYKGVNSKTGGLSMDVRVNPLVSFVWLGFVLMVIGMTVAFVGRFRRD